MKDFIARKCGVYYSFLQEHPYQQRTHDKYQQMTFCLRAIFITVSKVLTAKFFLAVEQVRSACVPRWQPCFKAQATLYKKKHYLWNNINITSETRHMYQHFFLVAAWYDFHKEAMVRDTAVWIHTHTDSHSSMSGAGLTSRGDVCKRVI